MTLLKFTDLKYANLLHPTYSHDLSPTGYYFFHVSEHFSIPKSIPLKKKHKLRWKIGLVWFGFVAYQPCRLLMPDPFSYTKTVLFQAIQLSKRTQFKCQQFYFRQLETIQFSINTEVEFQKTRGRVSAWFNG